MVLPITTRAQEAAAASYGFFKIGGTSNYYYPVRFTNRIYGAAGPNTNTSDLVIFRANTHEDASWSGTFSFEISFHPTNWGHFTGQIVKLVYQTGNGSPYDDPIGDVADGSATGAGDDLVVWLKGGATYHWRNNETTAAWSLVDGNVAGGSIVDSSGISRAPIASQSALIGSAKNNFYVNALGLSTQNNLSVGGSAYFNGNVGIGTTSPAANLDVIGILHAGGLTNPTVTTQGAYLGWNALTGGTGETDLINNQGYGSGGFAFMNTPASGNPRTTLMFLTGSGSLGIGTTGPTAKLEVNGSVKLTGGSGGSITFADGTTQSTAWTGVLCGGDYAESVDVTGDRKHYEPGDVLVVDADNPGSFLKSSEPYSMAVAGIYSTKPGVIGRRKTDEEKAKAEVPMAMVGIVPTKVTTENGAIRPGDVLVTSSTVGYAMKGTDRSRLAGAIVGKALGKLQEGTGIIDVLVSLQ
jgi:hypothetical protein